MKILVPIDGSKQSLLALEKAKEFIKNKNDEIIILNVIDARLFENDFVETNNLIHEAKESSDKLINNVKKSINSIKCKSLIEYGSPKHVIIDKASDEKADLIIMGANGLNALETLLIGSTTNYVISHSSIPVLVMPIK